jgi:anti-sigma-K factor RskA
MNPSADDTKELVQLMQRLSPGERSVLVATLETPNSQIATVRDTPNDRLWSRMVELGLAQEMTLEVNLLTALKHMQPRSFALTELGRAKIPGLLFPPAS